MAALAEAAVVEEATQRTGDDGGSVTDIVALAEQQPLETQPLFEIESPAPRHSQRLPEDSDAEVDAIQSPCSSSDEDEDDAQRPQRMCSGGSPVAAPAAAASRAGAALIKQALDSQASSSAAPPAAAAAPAAADAAPPAADAAPPAADAAALSDEQRMVVQAVLVDKQNVFFTGCAGTGEQRGLLIRSNRSVHANRLYLPFEQLVKLENLAS